MVFQLFSWSFKNYIVLVHKEKSFCASRFKNNQQWKSEKAMKWNVEPTATIEDFFMNITILRAHFCRLSIWKEHNEQWMSTVLLVSDMKNKHSMCNNNIRRTRPPRNCFVLHIKNTCLLSIPRNAMLLLTSNAYRISYT